MQTFETVNVNALAKKLADLEFEKIIQYNRFGEVYEEEVNGDKEFEHKHLVLRQHYQEKYDKLVTKYETLILEYSED